jgi:hypothetical protein
MPYDNEYNRKIKSDYQDINKRFIEHQKLYNELFHHSPMVSGLANKRYEGGAIPKELNSDVDLGINQGSRIVYGDASQYGSNFGEKDARNEKEKYVENLDVEHPAGGKAGYARGTFRDTGFERTIGAGKEKGVKVYKKKPLKLSKFIEGDVLGSGKKRGRPSKMKEDITKIMVGGTELGLPQKFIKKGGAKPKCKICKRVKCKCEQSGQNLEGAGFFDDLWKGIKKVAKPIASVAKTGLSLLPIPQAQMAASALDALGAGKKRGRPSKMKGGKLIPVENMKSSSMAGQGKPKNKRIEIVKNIMKEKGLSMIEASKYVKANNLY